MAQIIRDYATGRFGTGQNVTILREYANRGLINGFDFSLSQLTLPPMVTGESFAMEYAIERILEYSTWPSVTMQSGLVYPQEELLDIMREFITGSKTARESAMEMESSMAAWFDAERGEIAEIEEAQEPEYEPRELPIRRLTVRTSNMHTAVIRQAAEAINQNWQAMGKPYLFYVDIEEHAWQDWQGADARKTRLQTELMAGLGPDMFLFNDHEMHSLAASGFLRNIYELIDACQFTNRSDFFEQALQAFEINNGLYMFPVAFGFQHIGVNANLPQEFLDRFAQKESINLMEMMQFYLDLMDAHGDEWGDFKFYAGDLITRTTYALQTAMGGFVDFNTRTANLTSPDFIAFLELMATIYGSDWDAELMSFGLIGTPGWLREMAQYHIFFSQSVGINAVSAFFTADPPIFMHHIPHVDNYGRLLLRYPLDMWETWAGICITTAGDGELAWELTRHMIYAYTNPVLRATLVPGGGYTVWGNRSLSSPILRHLAPAHALRVFEHAFETYGNRMQRFVGFDDEAERARQFENAVNRIAQLNEMPMGMLSPMIPWFLIEDHFDQFRHGLITAETAAQRMHNAVSLWLIE